jgi:small subunit ribosomal protein S19e
MSRRGHTVKDVPSEVFVQALAQHFKKSDKFKIPAFIDIVKTATWKELPPSNPDWFYVRAAAVARRVYVRGGSAGGLSKTFGGRKRRGSRPNKHADASEGVIRRVLQQLDAAGITAKDESGGRRITKEGQKELDTVAGKIEIRGGLGQL